MFHYFLYILYCSIKYIDEAYLQLLIAFPGLKLQTVRKCRWSCFSRVILEYGEPHLCGQLPTSEPVYVVVNNSYTVNPICNHNCVQKYTSVYPLLLTKLFACMFRVPPYW